MRWTCDSKDCGFESRPFRFQVTSNNLGQVIHTHVPLTQSSIFGTSQEAVVPCSWEGNRGSDVTDFSGLSTYRLTAQEREISIKHPAYTPHGSMARLYLYGYDQQIDTQTHRPHYTSVAIGRILCYTMQPINLQSQQASSLTCRWNQEN